MKDLDTIKATVRKMQAVVLDMLCDIDSFCAEHRLLWFLSGGTCLGAVRHHGFIPWDDDGDIMLPRPDYEKFLPLFKEKFRAKYGVGSLETDPQWHRQNAKIWHLGTKAHCENLDDEDMGIFVDVFPIDGVPDAAWARKLHYGRLKVLCGLQNACVRKKFLESEGNVAAKKWAALLARPFGARFFTKRLHALARKHPFASSELVGAVVACHYGDRETIPRACMEKETRLLFEGHSFPVPVGYEQYLANLYGDYMTIPEGAEERGYSHLDHWTVDFGADGPDK